MPTATGTVVTCRFLAPSYLGALPKHRHQRGPRYGTKSSGPGTLEFYGFIVPDTTSLSKLAWRSCEFPVIEQRNWVRTEILAGHAPHILSISGFGWDRKVSHSPCGCYLSAFAGCATCFSWAPHYGSPGIAHWRVKGTASAVESCSFSWSNRQEGRPLSDLSRGPLDSSIIILSWVEHWSMRKWWIDLWRQKA